MIYYGYLKAVGGLPMADKLMQATGIQDALNLLVALILLLIAIVVIAATIYVWAKFHALPKSLKTILIVGLIVLVAYAAGLWTPQGTVEAWKKVGSDAVDAYNRFDGYTRTHRYIGIIILALLVPLTALQATRTV
jgi:hypothetical protein